MNRFALFLCLVVCIVSLVGCGGNDNSPQAFRGATPYIGSWAGAWTTPGSTDADSQGDTLLTVANNSVITGSMTTGTRGTGTLDGNITAGGEFYIDVKFQGSTDNLHGFATLDTTTNILAADGVRTTGGQKVSFHLQLSLL